MSDNSFIKIPKALYTKRYNGLNDATKMLYVMLLNKMKNSRTIQDNRIYILLTQKDLAEMMSCGERTAFLRMKELEKWGLVERGEPPHGKTRKIYLKNADTGEEITEEYYNRKT